MDFALSEEQKLLKSNAQKFLQKEILPVVPEYERKGLSNEEARKLLKKLIPFGYVGSTIPRRDGGHGLSVLSYGLLVEELASVWGAFAPLELDHWFGAFNISHYGTESQKQKFLPPLLSGDMIHAFALTEPDVGSNLANLRTTAVLDKDKYILNGTKVWIGNGVIADLVMVLVLTDPAKGTKGTSVILVEKGRSPFEVRALNMIGVQACPLGELHFEKCNVPQENLLGEKGAGYKQILISVGTMRALVGLLSVGIAQASINAAIKYAKGRYQFGKAIGSFQLIQEMIADMYIETEAARFLCYRTLDLADKGQRHLIEASAAKAYATEIAVSVASKAVQIHGAYGLSKEYPVERYFRDARINTVPDGTTQIHKLIIGRELLGIAAFG